VAAGPAPADVVSPCATRVQTLKEMAEKAEVWYRPLDSYDETAVAKHLAGRGRAAGPGARSAGRVAGMERRCHRRSAARHSGALGIGMGKVAQPLRVAITGTQVSPDISHTVYLAGREEALKRIDAALTKVAAAA
jgi:glutamyl-tRNA synthetase